MTVKRIELTADDILNKEFKKSMRGYNEEEVDAFLDIIIRDYELFEEQIAKLKEENERFKKNTETNKRQQQHAPTQVNYDVLKRLSNLEREVFGQKLNEKEG